MAVLVHKSDVSTEQKMEALEQVLRSRTFQKSDLLKQFLQFVCRKEMLGQGGDITEFSIATEALGRPQDFSPDEDSSVRSRAHALRKKLEDYYREEGQDAPVRIGLPKGSYVPEFTIVTQEERPAFVERPSREVQSGYPYGIIAIAFLAGIAVIVAAMFLVPSPFRRALTNHPVADVIRSSWGPLLNADADDLIVIGVPHQFIVRDFAQEVTPKYSAWYPKIEQSQQLLHWYFDTTAGEPPERFLLLHPNIGSPLWGDAAGAVGISKLLSEQSIKHEVLPERVIKPYALHGRNAILFGNPDYSQSVRVLLANAPFSVVYDSQSGWEAIANRKPLPGEPDAFRVSRSDDSMGLISVFREDSGAGRVTQVVAFSGLKSGGTEAAQEFFSSRSSMEELLSHFKAEGLRDWPGSYQVVVQTRMTETLPIQFSYRTHRIIRR